MRRIIKTHESVDSVIKKLRSDQAIQTQLSKKFVWTRNVNL